MAEDEVAQNDAQAPRRRIHWLLLVPLVVSMGFVGLALLQLSENREDLQHGRDSQALPSVQEGRAAPALSLVPLADFPLLERADLPGGAGEQEDADDQPLTLVNFWASWCPPCRAEHPTLTALAEAGSPLYGVNYRDRPQQALSFLSDLGNPFAALGQDPDASVGRDWGVIALPETFFLDAEGTVVLHFRGPITGRVLDTQIRPALAERGFELPPLPQ